MKASIKFRDEQKPLVRAKIPLNIVSFPFQSGVVAGDSKELSLNLSTFFESGPSLRFSYRPNDSQNPFSFIFKTGIGSFGSPHKSPLTMSAEFNLIGNQNPSFFIHFKPQFGDFSLKKSQSSAFVKNLGDKIISDETSFINNGYFESKAAAGMMVNRVIKGTELSAATSMPLRDVALVNFRWGLRVPSQEAGRLPLLVMNKIGIEHVAKGNSKVGSSEELGAVCLDVKKQLEVIQAENGLLTKALSDLRSDISAGKIDFFSEHHRNKYPAAGDGTEEGFKIA